MKKNIQIIWELIKKYVSLHQNKEKRNFNLKKGSCNLFQSQYVLTKKSYCLCKKKESD